MLNLCLTGDGGIDWTGVGALKTHVSMFDALELEDLKCAAGDARHEFQAQYPKYQEWLKRQSKQAASADTPIGAVSSEALAEELAMYKQAITEQDEMLKAHRVAVLAGDDSPFSDADIDAAHAMLANLRQTLPAIEAAALEAENHGGGQ